MNDVVTAVLAAGVAAGYFAIAALIVPRIHLEDATRRFVTAFRVGGVAFFVGCGLTHTHIAYHALVDQGGADTHEIVFHLLQVFGVWVFVFAAVRFLDVRVVRRKTPEERLRMAQELTLAVQQIAFDGMRERHPELSDDDIWLKLAVLRLGEDVVRKVYGRVP